MKTNRKPRPLSRSGKVLIHLLAFSVLLALAVITRPAISANSTSLDEQLYYRAGYYLSRGEYLRALLDFASFRARLPAQYQQDSTFRYKVDNLYDTAYSYVERNYRDGISFNLDKKNTDINSCMEDYCQNHPCSSFRSAQSLPPVPGQEYFVPLPGTVMFFTGANYAGAWEWKPVGNYYNPEQFGLPNDSIASIKVGSGARVYLCWSGGLTGGCQLFNSDRNDLSKQWIGLNTTSLRIENDVTCDPGPDEVALYLDFDYNGPCEKLAIGDYWNAAQFRLPDHMVSSVKVGSNVIAQLCPYENLSGTCEDLSASDPNLSNNVIGNDQVSSVKVYQLQFYQSFKVKKNP